MSADERDRWNARYREADHAAPAPARFLISVSDLLPRAGRARDVGGGSGRNAIWLARRGLDVTVVDGVNSNVRGVAAHCYPRGPGHLHSEQRLGNGPHDGLDAAGRRMVYQLAEDLFARLQRRSLLYHSRNSVGDVMSRITGDCWCVNQMVDALVFAPAHALLTSAIMVVLMANMDGSLTLLAVAVAPLMVGASFLVGKPLETTAKRKREVESRIQSHIQQTLTGIPVVQAFVQEDRERARFKQFSDAAIRAQQPRGQAPAPVESCPGNVGRRPG